MAVLRGRSVEMLPIPFYGLLLRLQLDLLRVRPSGTYVHNDVLALLLFFDLMAISLD
jgi:hypothetical protein